MSSQSINFSWRNFTSLIPSIFLNSAPRLFLLRATCVFAVLLLLNVPDDVFSVSSVICRRVSGMTFTPQEVPAELEGRVLKYEKMRIVYSYCLYSFTFLHQISGAFSPILPGIVDHFFIVGETVLFMFQAISGRWAPAIPRIKETFQYSSFPCEVTSDYLKMPSVVAVFTWAISLLLVLTTIMRIAEALETEGRYLWTRYDVTGFTRRAWPSGGKKRPNALKVLTGLRLWEPQFETEGKWIVRSRGLVALIFVAMIVGIVLNNLVLDPIREADEVPMRVGLARRNPLIWWEAPSTDVVVGIDRLRRLPSDTFNMSHAVTVADLRGECTPSPPGIYDPIASTLTKFYFTNFRCRQISTISISVNFTLIGDFLLQNEIYPPVQVMVGHSSDTSTVIRRTEVPVVLLPGMKLLGFAHQHKVRQFRTSLAGLSTLGLLAPFDEFLISEVTQVQPNSISFFKDIVPPASDDTASLVIFARTDFSDIRVAQDYREKTISTGLSHIGGLLTVVAFIFGALFGISILRVAFGIKPVAIVGVAHTMAGAKTLQRYRKRYPLLDSDIQTLRANPGLMALLVDHLIDLDLLIDDSTLTVEHSTINQPAVDSDEHELLIRAQELVARTPNRGYTR